MVDKYWYPDHGNAIVDCLEDPVDAAMGDKDLGCRMGKHRLLRHPGNHKDIFWGSAGHLCTVILEDNSLGDLGKGRKTKRTSKPRKHFKIVLWEFSHTVCNAKWPI